MCNAISWEGFGHNFDFELHFSQAHLNSLTGQTFVRQNVLQAACVQEVNFECKPLEIIFSPATPSIACIIVSRQGYFT